MITVQGSLDHENRLTLTAIGDPDTSLESLYEAIGHRIEENKQAMRPKQMTIDEQNARAFADCERAYLEAPE